jgi:hypothetical protein
MVPADANVTQVWEARGAYIHRASTADGTEGARTMREETSISEDGSRSDALLGTAAWCLALAALTLVASSVVQVIGCEGT